MINRSGVCRLCRRFGSLGTWVNLITMKNIQAGILVLVAGGAVLALWLQHQGEATDARREFRIA